MNFPERLSVSKIMDFFKSPLEYYYWHVEKNERYSDTMYEGTLLHEAILEPEKFKEKYYGTVELPEGMRFLTTVADLKEYLKENNLPVTGKKEELEDRVQSFINESSIDLVKVVSYWMKEKYENKIQVSEGMWKAVCKMSERVLSNQFVSTQIKLGENLFEHDVEGSIGGVHTRGRIDWIIKTKGDMDVILDLKKTKSAHPRMFGSTIYRDGYFIQADLYRDLWKQVSGRDSLYVWVVVERTAPYICEVYPADFGTLDAGGVAAKGILKKMRRCYEAEVWPGYTDGKPQEISIPMYGFDEISAKYGEEI